jgi:ethanolamine utilization protein EutQ (cupin superfamily)
MATHIKSPSVVEAGGNVPMVIEEFIGRVNSSTDGVSIARLKSPGGWIEPRQTPEFDEYSIILSGTLYVTTESGTIKAGAGETVITYKGEWVQYSTPESDGAEYIAVCLPAFSMERAHRE